jgi:hypothetical protein
LLCSLNIINLNTLTEHNVMDMLKVKKKLQVLDVSDMMRTFWRLIINPTLMCNNLASVFYFMGYMPYWVFMAKYIETQYRQSASTSSLVTGKGQRHFRALCEVRSQHCGKRLSALLCQSVSLFIHMERLGSHFNNCC